MKRFHPWFITITLLCVMFTFDMIESPVQVERLLANSSQNTFSEFDAEVAAVVDLLRQERQALKIKMEGIRSNKKQVELGRFLFFDKLLSGNKNISCATCHHSLTVTGDGLSLPIGEGGNGIGLTRDTGKKKDRVHERVPRNAPHVFNLGLVEVGEFPIMFWDGRVAADQYQPSGFMSPAKNNLPVGLHSSLAAQAMFPVTSAAEMAGQAGENSIANFAAEGRLAGAGGVWDILAKRLRNNAEYIELFKAAFKDINQAEDITYVHAANAIAAFEGVMGSAMNSPFDRYLLGDSGAISKNARAGMRLFYGKGGCADCHSGVLQTDNKFYSIAMPQIGPGKGDGSDGHDDFGRERETKDPLDRYRFRTPSLRNVVVTGPWSHAGAYTDLEAVVRHHLDPMSALENYDTSQAILPPRKDLDALDFIVHNDPARRAAIAASSDIDQIILTDKEVSLIVDFLHALTDPSVYSLPNFTPLRVPSGLPVVE